MRTRRAATITDLRRAVDCLPRATADRDARGDPLQRRSSSAPTPAPTGSARCWPPTGRGGRTDFISFAKAWDRFALSGSRRRSARRATRRELLVLTTQLEASLLDDEAPVSDLAAAIAEHHEARVSREDRDGDDRPTPDPAIPTAPPSCASARAGRGCA